MAAAAEEVKALGKGQKSGFSGVTVDAEGLRVDVWWKGAHPRTLDDLAASQDVVVRVHAARHSHAELTAAVPRLLASRGERKSDELVALERDVTISAVTVEADGSGLSIVASPRGSHLTGARAIATAAQRVAGVSVTNVQVGRVAPATATRSNDAPSWFGGGTMIRNTSDSSVIDYCSTGFAVDKNSDGTDMLLSAAHCDDDGGAWNWYDGTRVDRLAYGSGTSFLRSGADSMLMDPIGDTAGNVFTGSWSSGTSKRVAGTSNNNTGERVCTSGAISGEHCSLAITNDAAYWSFNGYRYGPGSIAKASSGIAVAAGDSGGPVYATRSDGRVTARGIISAGLLGDRSCPSTRISTDCSSTVYYYPIQSLQKAWGVTVKTRPAL